MAKDLFSIVIPTRERHDTLKYAIQSVLSQTYRDFELVIMDNFSSHKTFEVIDSFGDSRIRYYRSSERLSMTDNWELGLSYANGKYIFVMGDDDAVMPDGIDLLVKLISEYDINIVSWFRPQYWWTNAIVPWMRNTLDINLSQEIEVFNSREMLKLFYQSKVMFEHLPMIYNSWVHKDVITKVKSIHGRYFMSYSPDIHSGIVNAYFTNNYVYSMRPLSIAGLSGHSTGSSTGYSSLGSNSLHAFIADEKKDITKNLHPDLVPTCNQEIMVADTLLRSKELFFPFDNEISLNISNLIQLVAGRINRDPGNYENTIKDIVGLASKHGISLSTISVPIKLSQEFKPFHGPVVNHEGNITKLIINCEKAGISNVCQASRIVHGILPKIEEVRDIFKKLSSTLSQSKAANLMLQPLKLLIDGVMFQIHKSGITRIWESLFKEWADNGFSKHILVLDRAGTAPKIEGIRYRAIPPYDYNNTDADRHILQQVCNEENASFFISSYYTTPVSTPSVFMAYDMIPEMTGTNLASPMWKEKHYGIYHASSYISISENTAHDLAKCFPYISQDSVSIAYCGIEEHFKPASYEEIAQFKAKYGISKPYFLLVGDRIGFNGYKNAILFFRAFQMLDNKHDLEIVCVSRAALEPDFAPYISGTKVHVLTLSDDELRNAYSGAIALAYPSKYEGFGLPIAEAMSCGCPVITCKNASIPEVAGNAALYVNENNVDGLLNLLKVVQMPETRKTLISAGLKQVKKFSWRKMADIVASKFLSLSERFSAEEISKRPLYVNWLKTCADNFRKNPSDQACLEILRKERRKIAETFINTSQEKIGTVYQTYIGDAYNILLSKGIQSVPLREDEQAFIANIMSSVQKENIPNALESLLSNAYMPLINSMGQSVSLDGKEKLFVGNLISFAQKGQYHPQTLSWVLAAMLFLTLDIRRG